MVTRSRIGQVSRGIGTRTLIRSRRRSWILPVLIAAVMLVAGAWAQRTMEESLKASAREHLVTLLATNTKALRDWFDMQIRIVETLRNRDGLRRIVAGLAAMAEAGTPRGEWASSPLQEELRNYLEPFVLSHRYQGYGVLDPQGRFLAAADPKTIGNRFARHDDYFLVGGVERDTIVTPPVPLAPQTKGDAGHSMFVITRLRRDDGTPIGSFGFRLDPEEFTRHLEMARPGRSGETYAFDAEGTLISYSRFEDQLREIGLIPRDPSVRSIFNISVRDPGGNMITGHRPASPRLALSLTHMAASAIAMAERSADEIGIDWNVEGYPDYRGVPVVGAWTWLKEYGFGLATEIDEDEAFGPLGALRAVILLLLGLLGLAAIGGAIANLAVQRLRAKVNEAQQLGQYTLGSKIGEGGMGEVYRARHAMLKRPTAIKLLRADQVDRERLARFEREVQLTSRLAHHNTVAIYDYGISPDGAFYYAMEYVDGFNLNEAVQRSGAMDPRRVVHLLRQACGSLAEAHGSGIVHRDIKPANLMISQRPGMHDHLKVLDFGLVKHVAGESDVDVTRAGNIVGTPRYGSPEAFRSPDAVDARSDLYSLGAVGYFMVTGRHVFDGETMVELVNKHLTAEPVPPSERLGRPVPPALERLLLACLSKDPAKRPIDALTMGDLLDRVEGVETWTRADAERWWQQYGQHGGGLPDIEEPSDRSGESK